jgi:hypothetical protein
MDFLRHGLVTLPIPSGWEDVSQIVLRDDSTLYGFRTNLVYSVEPTRLQETAAEFAARQLPVLTSTLKNYELRSEGESTLGPNRGYLREHVFASHREGDAEDPEGVTSVVQIQFYVVKDGRVHTFTVTEEASNEESLRRIAEWLFSRARIDGKAADLQE